MQDGRKKPITIQGMKERRRSINELLDMAYMDEFVPDDEFAKDMELLVNGKLSPEEHREYLKKKYRKKEEEAA